MCGKFCLVAEFLTHLKAFLQGTAQAHFSEHVLLEACVSANLDSREFLSICMCQSMVAMVVGGRMVVIHERQNQKL